MEEKKKLFDFTRHVFFFSTFDTNFLVQKTIKLVAHEREKKIRFVLSVYTNLISRALLITSTWKNAH